MALSSHSPSVLPTPQPQSSRPSVPKFLSFPPPLTTFHFPAKPRTHEFSSTSAPEKWRAKVSFFPAFLKKGKDAKTLKEELLEAISQLDRGADATTEDQETVDQVGLKYFLSYLRFDFWFIVFLSGDVMIWEKYQDNDILVNSSVGTWKLVWLRLELNKLYSIGRAVCCWYILQLSNISFCIRHGDDFPYWLPRKIGFRV